MPHWEQLLRTAAMHTPGRKHQKRKGVKASQRAKNSGVRSSKHKAMKANLFHAQVRAYWAGERDTYPTGVP